MAKKQAAKAPLALKVVPIGNSRGIRIPREILTKYRIGDALLAEELEEGWLLRGQGDGRMTWEETYRRAKAEREDWLDWDATIADGLEEPW